VAVARQPVLRADDDAERDGRRDSMKSRLHRSCILRSTAQAGRNAAIAEACGSIRDGRAVVIAGGTEAVPPSPSLVRAWVR
jgi:hypothetical protein